MREDAISALASVEQEKCLFEFDSSVRSPACTVVRADKHNRVPAIAHSRHSEARPKSREL